MFTSVKIEQFVYELAQLDDNTGETTEARMDIIAETSSLRAMLDIRCFVSTLTSGWRSTRAHELEKHRRYVTHQDGRRCTNMQLYAAVVNTLGCVGQEFHDFCAAIDGEMRGKGRGKTLSSLLSLLAVLCKCRESFACACAAQETGGARGCHRRDRCKGRSGGNGATFEALANNGPPSLR